MSTERNLHSTSDAVIVKNNLSDVRTVQQKEKRDTETTNESSTATAINAIVEPLDKIIDNNNFETSMHTIISSFDAENTKVFFTAEKEQKADFVMVVNIPCSRHGEKMC